MAAFRRKSEGNVHVYPVKDIIKHETNRGADCYCEPVISELVFDPTQNHRIVGRVITHQRLKGKKNDQKK